MSDRPGPDSSRDSGSTSDDPLADHPAVRRVREALATAGASGTVRTLDASARTAAQAAEQLGTSVAVYLEAGSSGDAVPSTIVDLTGSTPQVRRAGALSIEALREVLPEVEELP